MPFFVPSVEGCTVAMPLERYVPGMRDWARRKTGVALYLALYATAGTGFALWNLLDGGNDAPSMSRTVRLVASSAGLFLGLAIAWFAGRVWQSRTRS